MKIIKQFFTIVLRVGISILLLYLVFKQVDVHDLVSNIKSADRAGLIFAFAIFFLSNVLCIFRWQMLLKGANINLPLSRIIISLSGGLFFSLFMPSTIGGDLVRSVDLSTYTKKPKSVVASVLLDRLSGYVGLVIIAMIAAFLGWRYIQDTTVLIALGIITGLLIAILLAIFNRSLYLRINRQVSVEKKKVVRFPFLNRIKDILKDLHHEMYIFRHQRKLVLINVSLSVLIQISAPFTFYYIGKALGIQINWLYYFIFPPIISAITLLPISIGGLGVRDAMTVFFFAKAHVGKDLALTMSLLNFLFIVVVSVLGGLIYVFTVRHRRVQHNPPSAVPEE
ncbi:MAG TPA: lysylphosphatidylglycerol synthase transmembrane domain-containing protein [Candidatus Omnitrophota bacterium]|nr:lysylphosphatidylglycerol synthase transmembrane domain-containing protein [Candidatus Omnitrophota bacterium]HPT07715.1 lysylphosphatidylglycerol synthase transmembrane domain-containing protein [Candidatus Omnitrophota bacterium]